MADGVVTKARYHKDLGRYVTIRHNDTYDTQYLHMSRIADRATPGVRVRQGDVIGYVGSSGLATGPHLEFRLWKQGKPVNPATENLPTGEAVDPAVLPRFTTRMKQLQEQVDAVALEGTSVCNVVPVTPARMVE